jgi:hypothetical protein
MRFAVADGDEGDELQPVRKGTIARVVVRVSVLMRISDSFERSRSAAATRQPIWGRLFHWVDGSALTCF